MHDGTCRDTGLRGIKVSNRIYKIAHDSKPAYRVDFSVNGGPAITLFRGVAADCYRYVLRHGKDGDIIDYERDDGRLFTVGECRRTSKKFAIAYGYKVDEYGIIVRD
jgi:hypothetical protein